MRLPLRQGSCHSHILFVHSHTALQLELQQRPPPPGRPFSPPPDGAVFPSRSLHRANIPGSELNLAYVLLHTADRFPFTIYLLLITYDLQYTTVFPPVNPLLRRHGKNPEPPHRGSGFLWVFTQGAMSISTKMLSVPFSSNSLIYASIRWVSSA